MKTKKEETLLENKNVFNTQPDSEGQNEILTITITMKELNELFDEFLKEAFTEFGHRKNFARSGKCENSIKIWGNTKVEITGKFKKNPVIGYWIQTPANTLKRKLINRSITSPTHLDSGISITE